MGIFVFSIVLTLLCRHILLFSVTKKIFLLFIGVWDGQNVLKPVYLYKPINFYDITNFLKSFVSSYSVNKKVNT